MRFGNKRLIHDNHTTQSLMERNTLDFQVPRTQTRTGKCHEVGTVNKGFG